MSLRIFTNESDIPKDLASKVIIQNDDFFDTQTLLSDKKIVREIISQVDNGSYHSENYFIPRNENIGAISRECLSTGSKTLINIVLHPDYCFDIIECGNNAIQILPLIKNGSILWRKPTAVYSGQEECDVIYKNQKYNNFYDLLDTIYEEE